MKRPFIHTNYKYTFAYTVGRKEEKFELLVEPYIDKQQPPIICMLIGGCCLFHLLKILVWPTTVKLRAEAHVTIQEIKSLGVLQTETCH